MDMSVLTRDLSPSKVSQNRRGEVIGASVPLLILPTLAVALRLLSRRISKARFWVRCLTCYNIGEAKADREGSGTITLLYWLAYVSFEAPYGKPSVLMDTQFLSWGPSILELVCQSPFASFGHRNITDTHRSPTLWFRGTSGSLPWEYRLSLVPTSLRFRNHVCSRNGICQILHVCATSSIISTA